MLGTIKKLLRRRDDEGQALINCMLIVALVAVIGLIAAPPAIAAENATLTPTLAVANTAQINNGVATATTVNQDETTFRMTTALGTCSDDYIQQLIAINTFGAGTHWNATNTMTTAYRRQLYGTDVATRCATTIGTQPQGQGTAVGTQAPAPTFITNTGLTGRYTTGFGTTATLNGTPVGNISATTCTSRPTQTSSTRLRHGLQTQAAGVCQPKSPDLRAIDTAGTRT